MLINRQDECHPLMIVILLVLISVQWLCLKQHSGVCRPVLAEGAVLAGRGPATLQPDRIFSGEKATRRMQRGRELRDRAEEGRVSAGATMAARVRRTLVSTEATEEQAETRYVSEHMSSRLLDETAGHVLTFHFLRLKACLPTVLCRFPARRANGEGLEVMHRGSARQPAGSSKAEQTCKGARKGTGDSCRFAVHDST